MRRFLSLLVATALPFAPSGGAPAEPPRVVVSIKPLHSLVAAVMDGVGQPVLLVKSGADPHDYSLKPSDAAALSGANLVVWSGAGVETFLGKPVAALAGKAKILRLDSARTLKRLKAREGGLWEEEEHEEKAGDKRGDGMKHGHDEIDGHVWLDPDNAAAIVRAAARDLSALDAANAATYAANRDKTVAALKALDAELRKQLAPLKGKRFIVSHDSIQYFEKRYGLAAAGSISISPERPPSAKRLYDIRARIQRDRVVCVFGEPQVPDKLVKTAVEGTKARTGTIDTDGGLGVPEGKDAYFTIMRNMAKALTGCLGG
ncbi:MAG TPA: zinc ABC transporter substrate-binding protein [Alphaproteobacteria bacterium]